MKDLTARAFFEPQTKNASKIDAYFRISLGKKLCEEEQMRTTDRSLGLSKKRCVQASSTALKIIEQWGASREQACSILHISYDIYSADKHLPTDRQIELNQDQMFRISLILNIHGALRTIFDNPKNVYGFMAMANHNEYFDGRAPFDIISRGDLESLIETFRRIEAPANA